MLFDLESGRCIKVGRGSVVVVVVSVAGDLGYLRGW